jgi:hypothetical protein
MIQKLRYRVDPLLAGNDDAFAALRPDSGIINKIGKIVTLDFFLDCSKQNGFLHSGSTFEVQKKCGREAKHGGLMLTAKGNFQASQTAKARLGLPCAVTPREGTRPPAR